MPYDLIVIGSGPGGYSAAERATAEADQLRGELAAARPTSSEIRALLDIARGS